jgi:transcriptional regulator with XRE-family HTH domain
MPPTRQHRVQVLARHTKPPRRRHDPWMHRPHDSIPGTAIFRIVHFHHRVYPLFVTCSRYVCIIANRISVCKRKISMNTNLFSERLRRARMAAGLQGKELAKRLGISRPYLSQIEKGLRNPSPELLTRLAAELQISMDDSGDGSSQLRESSHCRYPEACDIQAEFRQLREEMASITAQLDTVTRLLGAALGSALPAQRDHNQPHPHKAHQHRAAG